MTEPTPNLVTIEVVRFHGDDAPATYTDVDDVKINEQGFLTIDHDVAGDTVNRTFYAPGHWAAAQITGIHKPKVQPRRPERRVPDPLNPYAGSMPGIDPYDR